MSITFKVTDINQVKVRVAPFNIKCFVEGYYNSQNLSSNDYYFQEYKKLDEENLPTIEKDKKLDGILKDLKEYEKKLAKLRKESTENIKILSSSFKFNNNNNRSEKYEIYNVDGLNSNDPNSFIYSCWKAYNLHHHLEIRPDDVYMAIMVQFSFYVNKHSEEFRDRLVDFQGKQNIEVLTNDPILVAQHDKLTLELAQKMKSCIKDPSIASWVIPEFTTTTESDKVAFASVLLSTMKKYFDYSMRTRCGLPSVTLLGTIEDWSDIKQRIQKLKEFNLDNSNNPCNNNLMDKWVSLLEPIIDQFILTASGNPDLNWWNSIVDYKQRSGGDKLSGWLSCFALFDIDGNWIPNESNMDAQSQSSWPTLPFNKIANGYVSAPILLIDGDGTEYNSTLFSGHIASSINGTKIKPSIDWFLLLNPSKSII